MASVARAPWATIEHTARIYAQVEAFDGGVEPNTQQVERLTSL